MRKLILLAVIALAGCAAPKQQLNTASGNPEVIIDGVTRKQVVDRIVDRLTGKGLAIHQVTEYKIVAGQKADDFGARFLFGSRYDGVPEYRITYTLVDQPPAAVKVYGRAAIVTNPGSAFERVRDMTDGQKHNLQDMLGKLRAELESKPSSGTATAPVAVPVPAPSATSQAPATTGSSGGAETYQAERLAKDQSCAAAPRAALLAKGAGFETYNVPCSNGDALMIRCEFGNCRVLR